MKAQLIFTLIITLATNATAQNVGIGNISFTPDASSILELRTTSGGFLMPRMTEAQKDAISSPASGLMIYQTNNTPGYYYYDGSAWQSFGASIDNLGDHTATQNLKIGPGIGLTDTDEDTKIYLEKTADEDNVRISVAGSEALTILNSGNVGIGTATPDRLLNIGSSTGAQMRLTMEDNSTQSGNTLGEIIFDSTDDTTPSTNDGSAMIRATASENHGNSNKGGNLGFFTKQTGTGGWVPATQRMTILHNSNVGVGTAVPSAQFHTTGSVRHQNLAGSGTRMVVADGSGNLTTQTIPSGGSSLWSQSGSDIYRNNAGDVGIGLTNPSYRFHVTQSNTGGGDNVIEFINTSNNGLVHFNDNLATNNSYHAMESWTNKNNNGGGTPFGVFGGSYSSSNGSNGGGVYGHVNSRRGIGVLGVRGNT